MSKVTEKDLAMSNLKSINDSVDCGNDSDGDTVSMSVDTESDAQLCVDNNNNNSNTTLRRKKTVAFSNMVTVILIPTKNELSRFYHDLFWSNDEVKQFKVDAQIELLNYALKTGFTVEESLELLYQPDSNQTFFKYVPSPSHVKYEKNCSLSNLAESELMA
jgi:hypothetical protein